MEYLLRSKGLYKITLGIEDALHEDSKLSKWKNKNDSSHGLIGISIFVDLGFHLQGIDSPIKSWEKLNTIFGIKNEI